MGEEWFGNFFARCQISGLRFLIFGDQDLLSFAEQCAPKRRTSRALGGFVPDAKRVLGKNKDGKSLSQ
jgi:hypothetical protein